MAKWEEARGKLTTMSTGSELDDYIDELVDYMVKAPAEPDATPFFINALPLAQSELTLRSVALAIAITAGSEDASAVDALIASFRQHRTHAFLAPALLDALALLATRSAIARAETASLLIRLTCQDSRFLLIKGAQIIGRFDPLWRSFDLRQKLHEVSTCSDHSVQAEIAIQQAFLQLADTLLSSDTAELYQRLEQTQAAFAHAREMEEHRPDAELFACLVEMLLAFRNLAYDRISTARRLQELYHYLHTVLATHWWPSYRSEVGNVCVARILEIADALQRSAVSVRDADDWTNMDEALTELAALYAVIRSQKGATDRRIQASHAYTAIADRILVPQLGPVLRESIGRRRLAKATENYVAAHGEDEYAAGLRAFVQVVAALEQTKKEETSTARSMDLSTQFLHLASALRQTPETMVQSFVLASRQGNDSAWVRQFGLGPVPLPVDRPEAFGGSGPVHEVTVSVLNELQTYLGPYPPHKWQRLITVVETIASFAKFVFDTLPEYAKCREDGGMGQAASEKDLQKALFSWLRQRFDDSVIYESNPLGGGRIDTGLQFPECKIPIEIKHEYSSIDPEHIRANYLTQADTYAAASDRVCFLLILDLRDTHARKRRSRITHARQMEEKTETVSLYSWQEGFWIDALPLDPQVPQARPKAVVICAIPGNRPTPSSTTRYSGRPSRGREKGKASDKAHDNQ